MRHDLRVAVTLLALLSACPTVPPADIPPSAPVPAPMPPTMPRRGLESRPEGMGPEHGLLLESHGLVNETFTITVDFDARRLVHIVHLAVDGSDHEHARDLTDAEITALIAERDRVWGVWEPPPARPSAEYDEAIYLLDGGDVTGIHAQGGFIGAGAAGELAKRLQDL
jgi:hypothetical protein